MIPKNLHELPLMTDIMKARGEEPADIYSCRCGRMLPAPSFVCTDELGPDLPRFVCSTCASDVHRRALAAQEQAEAAQLDPWDTEAGRALKVDRDRRVNGSLWTDAPGSPLTSACRAAWTAWRTTLFRLTLDFAGPEEVTWPEEPGLEYGPD